MGKGRIDLSTFTSSVTVGTVPTSVAIGPGPDDAYVANQLAGYIGVVDVPAGLQGSGAPFRRDPFASSSATARLIFVSTNIDSVFAINTTTQAIVGRGAVRLDPNGMALATSGATLYVTN